MHPPRPRRRRRLQRLPTRCRLPATSPGVRNPPPRRPRPQPRHDHRPPMHATLPLLARTDFPALRRRAVETLQVNLGYRCNQSCVHCHVAAGPNRTEEMSREDVEAVVAFLGRQPQGAHARPDRRRARAEPALPHPGDGRARPRRARHRPLQPDDHGRTRPGDAGRVPGRQRRRGGGVDALLPGGQRRPPARPGHLRRRASAACAASTPSATRSRAAASSSAWSTTRRGRACRRRSRRWRPTTGATCATRTASPSTASTRSPTCRSSASARCSSRRAPSATTWRCCAARTARPTSSR